VAGALSPGTDSTEHLFRPDLVATVRRALADRGTIISSPPLADELAWLRVFAYAAADRAGEPMAVGLVIDTRPLFNKLKILSADPNARVVVLGAQGRPAPVSDPDLAEAVRLVAGGRLDAPRLNDLVRRMRASERGSVWLSAGEARALALGEDEAVAVYAPINVQEGDDWSIALVASIEPLRAHQRAMTGRIVATIAAVAVFLAGISVVFLLMSRRAIALRVRAEQAERLAHLHEKSEKIVETIPTGVIAIGATGTVTAVNRVLRERLGDEAVGEALERAFPSAGEGVPERLRALFEQALATQQVVSTHGENLRLFGEEGQYNVHAVPLEARFEDARVLLVIEDVSMVRSLETQLLRSEKLATVGVLAAGIAHEVGTPLGVVRGRAELAQRKLGEEHPVSAGQKVIVEQIDKVTRTIRQLLDFARTRTADVREVEGAAALDGVGELLRYEAESRGVALEVEAAALPPLIADPDQLQQVLVNLVMNALDACERGGRVRIASKPSRFPGLARLVVEDDGRGIPEPMRNQIFDPFFTTKKRGQGTGLGLSIVSQTGLHLHPQGGLHERAGPGHGRVGHGQGAGGPGHPPGELAQGRPLHRHQLRGHPREPARVPTSRRLRLPGVRLAGAGADRSARGVLRERRQGRRRGGHPRRVGAEFFAAPLRRRAGRADHWLGQQGRITDPMVPAGRDHYQPIPGTTRSRCRRAPAGWTARTRRSSTPRAHLQRGGLPATSSSPGARHQQPARLLQHVPRVERGRPDRDHRHRQGHGHASRTSTRRRDPHGGPEPGHQPPAHAHHAGAGQGARRDIVAVNPLPEAGAAQVPQPAEGLRLLGARHRRWPTTSCRSGSAATLALFQGSASCWSRPTGRVLDRAFIDRAHRRLRRAGRHSLAPDWEAVLEATGIWRGADRARPPDVATPQRTIICWAMGLTQHKNAVATIQEIVNVLLLRGNLGRPGAGPARCAATPTCRATAPWASGRSRAGVPRRAPGRVRLRDAAPHGLDTVDAIRAMRDGTVRVFARDGRQLRAATPDTEAPRPRCASCASPCRSPPSSTAPT
jgi:two-component system, NtrC family, sensor histidine kinase HydH